MVFLIQIKEKKMKKNFLKIAALLIAAMLLVVSCSQEVKAPENDGLVEATIGLAFGKDVTVGYLYNADITYKYTLTPEWSNLTNGAPIYGATNGEVLAYAENTAYKLNADNLPSFKPNHVTPGYWKIVVNGYVDDKVVLSGSTKAYFNNDNSSATVYVSPVKNENSKGSVTITLLMEDLDEGDADESGASKIKYCLDADSTGKPVTRIAKNETSAANSGYVSNKAAHEYSVTLSEVTAGYHTITFKVDEYEGGVTKSFLMIPGNNVTITGSIYPSKFKETNSTIKVVTLDPVVLSIDSTPFDSASDEPVIITETTFTATMADFANTGLTGNFKYEWYIDGVKQTGLDETSNEVSLTTPSLPGDYTVTCVATLTANDDAGVQHVLYGGEKFAGKIRVEASGNK